MQSEPDNTAPGAPPDVRELEARLGECMIVDRHRLAMSLRAAGRRGGDLTRIAEAIERSAARAAERQRRVPKIRYPAELPVVQKREDIAEAIAEHQVVVLCGETGSGKTTQLPKICLELGRGVKGMIGHTQPRRIAARSVAGRIAEELGEPLGKSVGYKVRFTDHAGADTLVKLMTDGILLAETQGDRFLDHYDTIIIDEAHERSLNIDFLLGYFRALLPKRPDLKLIVTSATIDPERFSDHFVINGKPAPIIEVSGRTYPVEVRYRPPAAGGDDDDRGTEGAILDAVDELARDGPGDVLVFLSGEREIRETAEALRKHHPPHTEIVPLYARLSADEQMRVFRPHAGRRIVLATNVAETSLTVPGIRYVVDPGFARISRYAARTRVQRLPIEPISRSSADQRAGRCGRVADGICIRLYEESDYLARPRFTDPEVLRTNLAGVILRMKALGLGAIENFAFIDPPESRSIKDGYDTLGELGALDSAGNLTKIGFELSKLPIDPRLARMVLAGKTEEALREVLVLAAALSVQDPRERPMEQREKADLAHAQWHDELSDFVAWLKLWKAWREQSDALSGSKLRRWCRENFLSFVRMREWEDTYRQIHAVAADMGYRENDKPAAYDALHRALLAGLLSNIGVKREGAGASAASPAKDAGEYRGARGNAFSIHPASGLFRKGPKWAMAAELVRTTRLYARTVAKIEPLWVERVAAQLIVTSHSDPHYEERSGRVLALERGTLFGLELYAGRRVDYGRINPPHAREIYIHAALVEPMYEPVPERAPPFIRHNKRLFEEVRLMEEKARRRDLLTDNARRTAFFAARLPESVHSRDSFERWRREAEKSDPKVLFMSLSDVLAAEADQITPERFPDAIDAGGLALKLDYRNAPGEADDGVTTVLPLEALGQVGPLAQRAEWLVPGLVVEKVSAMIRSLPSSLRKGFGPVQPFAEEFVQTRAYGTGSLAAALSEHLLQRRGIRVPPELVKQWGGMMSATGAGAQGAGEPVPPHLAMNFRVVDDRGRAVGAGRNLPELRATLAPLAQRAIQRAMGRDFSRDGITSWDFGDLPEKIELKRSWAAMGAGDDGGVTLCAFPALIDRADAVSLRLVESAELAARLSRAGVRRLFVIAARDELKRESANLRGIETMIAEYATLDDPGRLKSTMLELVAERAFMGDGAAVRTAEQFRARLDAGWASVGGAVEEVASIAGAILAEFQALGLRLSERVPAGSGEMVADIQVQVRALLPRDFLTATPWAWLGHVPRFLRAARLRLDKFGAKGAEWDRAHMRELAPLWWAYMRAVEASVRRGEPAPPAQAEQLRWLIEELRVSLWAQELGTSAAVSVKRLRELAAQVEVAAG